MDALYLKKNKWITYWFFSKGIFKDDGALSLSLSLLDEIKTNTIIVAKYGIMLKNWPGNLTPMACKFICIIATPPKI